MTLFLYKRVLIFSTLINSLSFLLLTFLEVDYYSFCENIFTLDSEVGILSSLFMFGVLLIALEYILKIFKKG
jgi:hypothetical protein